MLSGRSRFIRPAIVGLLAALTLGLPAQARAYRVAMDGVEVVALLVGPSLWDLTIETDTTIGDGAFEAVGATSFTPADPPCDNTSLICFGSPSADGLVIAFAVLAPTLTPNVGSPLLVGSLAGGVTSVQSFTAPGCLECFVDFRSLAGIQLPTTYLLVPEPSTALLLGVGIAALGLIRRRLRLLHGAVARTVRRGALAVSVVGAFVGWADITLAAPITFQYEGVVFDVAQTKAPLLNPLGVVVGAPVTVTFTFESTTPDTAADSNTGLYPNAILAMEATVGAYTVLMDPGGDLNRIVVHDFTSTEFYIVETSAFDTVGANPSEMQFVLLDIGTMLASDALPTTPPLLGPNTSGAFAVVGVYQAIVPEPSSLVLLGPGLVALGWIRRREAGGRAPGGAGSISSIGSVGYARSRFDLRARSG